MAISKDLKDCSEMDLVNIVNELEGFAWQLDHDAGDGRIDPKTNTSNLRKQAREATKLLKAKTGIKNREGLSEYIREKLQEQNARWDNEWAVICMEGSVFKLQDTNRFFETLRVYNSIHSYPGRLKQTLLARLRNSKDFTVFSDRDISRLEKVHVSPMYSGRSGIIKADEEPEKRSTKLQVGRYPTGIERWYSEKFEDMGTVFYHAGFKQVFETLGGLYPCVTIPLDKKLLERSDKEPFRVMLARSYQQNVLVEFTPKDLPAMKRMYNIKPKYTKIHKNGSGMSGRGLELD